MKRRVYFYLLLTFFIPTIITVAKKNTAEKTTATVTKRTDYNEKYGYESGLTYTGSDGKEKNSFLTTIELEENGHTYTAYCIDPGVAAPPFNSNWNCTGKTLTDNNAAKALSVFNSGETDAQTVGFGLRYAFADTMRDHGVNSSTVDAYTSGSGVQQSGFVKQGQKLGQNAIEEAKKIDTSSSKKTATPKASLKGTKVTYSNMPEGSSVTISCPGCTTTTDTEYLDKTSGSFDVDLEVDSTKCAGKTTDFTVKFNVAAVPEEDKDEDDGSKEDDTEKCTKATEYKCGPSDSAKFQRFVACTEKQKPSASKPGGGGGGGSSTPSELTLTGKLQCEDLCKDVVCPSENSLVTIPEEPADGSVNELCDFYSSTGPMEMIIEGEVLDTFQEIDCCVIDEPTKKLDTPSFSPTASEVCDPKIYCVEDYIFNIPDSNHPFSIDPADNPGNQSVITAGSYFQINGGPLQDKSSYYCYTENSPEKLRQKVETLEYEAAVDSIDQTTTCDPIYEQVPVYNCYTTNSDNEEVLDFTCEYDSSCCGSDRSEWDHDRDGELIAYYKTIVTLRYRPSLKYNDSSKVYETTWKWVENPAEGYSGRVGVDECTPDYIHELIIEPFEAEAQKYEQAFDKECNHGLAKTMAESIKTCSKKVYFEYYDGAKLGVPTQLFEYGDPVTLLNECETTESGRTSGCTDTGTEIVSGADLKQINKYCEASGSSKKKCKDPDSVYIDFGTDEKGVYHSRTEKFERANFSEATITKKMSYDIKGINICNNYDTGMRTFGKKDSGECTDTVCGNLNSEGSNGTCVTGWPVAYDTPQGDSYEYSFFVDDIKSCLNASKFAGADKDYEIYCHYDVNACHGCEFGCDVEGTLLNPIPEAGCEYNECGSDCQSRCVGINCIYDIGSGLLANYQPVSLLNFDTAFAILSSNYAGVQKLGSFKTAASSNNDQTIAAAGFVVNRSKNWANAKGQETMNLIFQDGSGETIYSGEPQYRVKLTPNSIREIQGYNRDAKGYLKNTSGYEINCRKIDQANEYIVCSSNFIRGYLSSIGVSLEENDNGFESAAGKFPIERKSGSGPAWK